MALITDINDKYKYFHDLIMHYYDVNFPEKRYRNRKGDTLRLKWFNDDLRSIRETLELLRGAA